MEIRRYLAVLVVVGAGLAVPSRLAGHAVPLDGMQQVEASQHILVAVVEQASPRWSGRLIVTDYALRVEDRLRGAAPDHLEITLPGGTIGAETHGTYLALPLDVGARYLLFLGDLDRPGLSPLVGGWPGAVRAGAGFEAAVSAVRAFLAGEPGDLHDLDSAVQDGLRQASEGFSLGTLAVPPVTFAPLPESSPFSPYDQEQMAYWNVYQPGLFQVGAPAVSWAFGNGVSEIAGFPDNAKMQVEFGQPWIGATYSFTAFRIVDGHVVEADIALNPGQRWTLDEAAATRPDGPLSFRQAILSDLGIAWGMRVSFSLSPKDRESVVAPGPPQYRFPRLYSDDAAAVRAAFGEAPLHDGLISAYSIVPFPLSPRRIPAVPSPASARRGGRFKVVGPIKLENVGTESLGNPVVEVYLAPERFSLDGAVLVKRLRVRASIAPGGLRNVDVGRITVPAALPPGVYFLAYRLRATGDEYRGNDAAWSDYNVTLTVKAD